MRGDERRGEEERSDQGRMEMTTRSCQSGKTDETLAHHGLHLHPSRLVQTNMEKKTQATGVHFLPHVALKHMGMQW